MGTNPEYGFGVGDGGRSYLESIGAVPSESQGIKGLQWVLPRCPFCGKERHLYVSDQSGQWLCYRCADDPSARLDPTDERPSKGVSFLDLVAILENTDKAGALELIMYQEDWTVREHTTPAFRAPVDTMSPVFMKLPDEYEPVLYNGIYRMPKYLQERNVTPEAADRFRLGFCQGGRYAGRIIMPIACPMGESYTARATWDTVLRYLSGPKANRLLYGWEPALEVLPPQGQEDFLLVEGPFDAIKLWMMGIPAVALQGISLKAWQRKMLEDLFDTGRIRRFVVLFDKPALEAALRTGDLLGRDRCAIARLQDHKDPAAAPEEAVVAAIETAKPWSYAALELSVVKAGLGR